MRLNEIEWFHGSTQPRDTLRVGSGGEDMYGPGIYLTTNSKRAQTYFGNSEGYIHSVTIAPDNEYNFSRSFTGDDAERLVSIVPKLAKTDGDKFIFAGRTFKKDKVLKGAIFALFKHTFKSGKTASQLVKELGYDAIRTPDPLGGEQIVMFDPNKVQVTNVTKVIKGEKIG